jgi:hypothetical protein
VEIRGEFLEISWDGDVPKETHGSFLLRRLNIQNGMLFAFSDLLGTGDAG